MNEENVIKKMLNCNPLIKFSDYTHIQTLILIDLGDEIEQILDKAIVKDEIGPEWKNAYGKFWLFVVGAYETIRTMSQCGEQCFSNSLASKLLSFKQDLAKIRMPFAKQEFQGKSKPIQNENSIYSFDFENQDILFKVKGEKFSMRELIIEFSNLINGIEPEDIINDHRTFY